MGLGVERFTTPLPEHLHCFVCLDVSYPPVIVCALEHQMCESCATELRKSSSKGRCPMCAKTMLDPVRTSGVLKRAIEDYKVTCRYTGCKWVGCLLDEPTHAESCDFREIPCALCKTPYAHSRSAEHMAVCPEEFVACPQGGKRCPRKKRCELDKHLSDYCGQWQCRVVQSCNTRTTFANLPAHEKGCADSTARIAKLEQALSQRNETLTTILAELRAKLDSLDPAKHASPTSFDWPAGQPAGSTVSTCTLVKQLITRASSRRQRRATLAATALLAKSGPLREVAVIEEPMPIDPPPSA
ncbi:hypothetical protein NBRC10513v2_002745 [Rhodotorula toruloides]|uniref:Proteophosphoglycan ppg4 n=1 Tax=Rhodotorula toruloides TaxID=5286 RepID=A0A2T0AA40_RHOTO|nr:Proteophosphoglycan ppg4 [Rhodotorula toruloides]